MTSRSRHFRRAFHRFFKGLRQIPLADRCLLLIFFILLCQSAVMLFSHLSPDGGEIDIIIRTSLASIFGYLLGGSMSGGETWTDPGHASALENNLSNMDAPEVEKSPNTEPSDMDVPTTMATPIQPRTSEGCCRFRILIAAGIGLFCLGILLLLRDWPNKAALLENSRSKTAIVVQFRDFISGSLGFLIGCSSQNGGDPPT